MGRAYGFGWCVGTMRWARLLNIDPPASVFVMSLTLVSSGLAMLTWSVEGNLSRSWSTHEHGVVSVVVGKDREHGGEGID